MTLVFSRDFEPRCGEADEIAPGVRRVTAGNAGPFTFRGTNTFLIGEDSLAVLDPGPADPEHVEALVRAIGGRRVAQILVSHSHADHFSAAPALKERTAAPILAGGRSPSSEAHSGNHGEWPQGALDMKFVPDRLLADGEILEGPGYRLEAVATPGHTADHFAFAWPERGLLFSGDHVMGWSTTVVAPPDGSMADYMASLGRLAERPERLYLPAHGAEITDAPDYVRALRTHRKMREAAILEAIRSGDRTIREVVARVYAGLAPALRAAAALSVLAHLEDLVARGSVHADGRPTAGGHYRPADDTLDAAPGSG